MAAMAMEREGDVSRFIDTYKFDQQREDIRQKYGGGTSLPLHSDGLEDRRQRLREERRQEMLLQQEKQPKESAYYRVGTPEKGLPGLGSYEEQRSKNNVERQREYNQFLQKQRQLEQQKLDARHRSPPRPPVQAPGQEMDYQASHEQARAEDRRYYQDYMKAKEERERAARGRTVTPPGGLDIGQYDRSLKENAQKRKNDYREILVQQQKEHMYLRARQEPEIPVIDRAAQQNNSLASKPPPGPGFRPREDPSRQTPIYWNEGKRARSPLSLDSEPSRRPNPVANSDIPLAFQTDSLSKPSERPAHGQPPYPGEGQRQTDISKLFPIDDARRTPPPRTPPHQFEDRRPNNPQTELTGRYSPSRPNRNEPGRPGSRDRWNLQRPAEPATTLLVGTSAVDSRRREGGQQRKQEYREYLERKNEEEQKKRDEMHQRAMSKPAEVVKNQYYSSDSYEHYQKDLHRKQSEEYRDFLNKQKQEQHSPYENFVFPTVARAEKPMVENMGDVVEQRRQLLREERKRDYERYQLQQKMKDVPRRHDYIDSTNGPFEDTGIFARLGDHGNTKDLLRDERKNEYLQHLEKYSDRGRSPMKPGGLSGPPVDHYQQMLNEKRREEAQHRRFDDPEFQDRYQNSRENQRYNY